MLVLLPPVDAPIARPFHYTGSPFARGLHRGVDFASRPGSTVGAPCHGRVVWAGDEAMTLLCARRRVTLLALAPSIEPGARVVAGEAVGIAGAEPLHLGVRRLGDPFGYENPERYLREAPPASGPPALPPLRLRPPAPRAAPPARPAPPLAPWPAWAGLGLAAAGTGWRWRARRRRARPRAAPQRVS